MASNVFDQFDTAPAAPAGGNVFDQFDKPSARKSPKQMKHTAPESKPGFIERTISNIPQSAINVGENIYTAIRHPLKTGKTLLDVGAGALESALAPESWKKSGNPFLYSPEAEKKFSATKEFYKNRYGSVDKALKTLETDPVGTALDVSATAGLLGKAAKISGAVRAGTTLGKISEITDPVRMAAKAATKVAKPAYEWGVGMSTGSGATAIREALKGGDAFTQAMRGKITETDVLNTARGALHEIKQQRGAAYRSQLAKLKDATTPIDISDVKSAAQKWLGDYGIKKVKNGLDFSRSTLRNNQAAASEVKAVYDAINEWGRKPGDTTAIGLDTLKRVIQDSYTTQNPSRAMVRNLANKVKSKIVSEVPEYEKMTKDYADASSVIDDMQRGLSLGDKAATDTALRKLMTAMREDKTFRRQLIEKLHEQSGSDVAGAVSGLLMKNPWSNRLGPIAHFYGTSAIAAYLHNPALVGLLPLASPRLMGEVSRYAGKAGRAAAATRPAYQAAYQAGRIPGVDTGTEKLRLDQLQSMLLGRRDTGQ